MSIESSGILERVICLLYIVLEEDGTEVLGMRLRG